jgi:hypothetical protein
VLLASLVTLQLHQQTAVAETPDGHANDTCNKFATYVHIYSYCYNFLKYLFVSKFSKTLFVQKSEHRYAGPKSMQAGSRVCGES